MNTAEAPAYLQVKPPLLPALRERPRAGPGLIFLWDAIDLAWRAKYGEQWSGEELSVLNLPVSPERERDILQKASQVAPHLASGRQRRFERVSVPISVYPLAAI